MRYRFAKRSMDVSGALLGLTLCGVPMLVVAGLIRWRMNRPIIHRSTRVGLHGRTFVLYKFRTMREAVDNAGGGLPDRDRVTALGRILRRTSLDELPQFFNVLKGDMSLVGPRPLLPSYLPLYTREQARRHDVRPGITGLAQIRGRNALSWNERFALDVAYVDTANVRLDCRILLETLFKVFRQESVSPDGDLDVPAFRGSVTAREHELGAD